MPDDQRAVEGSSGRRERDGSTSASAAMSRDEVMRLFRFGFIAYPAADEPQGDSIWRALLPHWHTFDVAGIRCRWHPQTRLTVLPSQSGAIIVIGDVFALGPRGVDEIVASLGRDDAGSTQFDAIDGLSGRFALLLLSPRGMVVLNDAFGARSVFHSAQGGIASHAALLAHAFGIRRRADVASFVRSPFYARRRVKYLPGHATVYEGVWALIPNHALDTSTGRQHRYWPRARLAASTLDAFIDHFLQYLAALIEFLRSTGRIPVIGITGGIDSRVLLAAFSAAGVDFRGVTWRGGYLRADEVETVDAIRRHLVLPRVEIDPGSIEVGRVASAGQRNSGNFRDASRLVEGMQRQFADTPQAVFLRGYGGEILRGFYNPVVNPVAAFGVLDMARLYGNPASSAGPSVTSYRTVVEQCFSEFQRAGEFDRIGDRGCDPHDVFYWEHRMGMWGSAMLNEMDPAVHSFVGFNSRRLYELAFGLPDAQRRTKDLLRTIVRKFDPRLADLPCS